MRLIKVNIDPTRFDRVILTMMEGVSFAQYVILEWDDIERACRKFMRYHDNAVAQYADVRMELTNTKHLELGAIPVTVDAVTNSLRFWSKEFLDKLKSTATMNVNIDPRPENSVVVSVANERIESNSKAWCTDCSSDIIISEKINIQDACARLQWFHDDLLAKSKGALNVSVSNSLFPEWGREFTTIDKIKKAVFNWSRRCDFK